MSCSIPTLDMNKVIMNMKVGRRKERKFEAENTEPVSKECKPAGTVFPHNGGLSLVQFWLLRS